MDAEYVINLYESYWFEHQFISKAALSPPPTPPSPPPPPPTPNLEIAEDLQKSELSRPPSRHIRSFSDQFNSQTSLLSETFSPKSVLTDYKLQTIVSGKVSHHQYQVQEEDLIEKPKVRKLRRNKGVSSKSLTDLEFEELKGFMDLGFVFSEEDKNSSLVSIIPGLQRLGKENQDHYQEKEEEEEEEEEREVEEKKKIVSRRPYLSEAWEVRNAREEQEKQMMMNWRFPSLSNETDMKHHLRSWAHTVASAVR